MMNLINPENDIQKLKRLIESNESSNIRLNANGGNSILLICNPLNEINYINTIKSLMDSNKYEIIDLNDLLCEFVKENNSILDESFELLQGSINQIFKASNGEEGSDLFSLILTHISNTLQSNKIPILINTGALYGSGIENIHIMESDLIMRASLPLIILYPATTDKDKIMFLGKRPSSKYRCMII